MEPLWAVLNPGLVLPVYSPCSCVRCTLLLRTFAGKTRSIFLFKLVAIMDIFNKLAHIFSVMYFVLSFYLITFLISKRFSRNYCHLGSNREGVTACVWASKLASLYRRIAEYCY